MGDLDKENWISWYNIPISKYTYNEEGFSSVSEELRNIMFKFYVLHRTTIFGKKVNDKENIFF